MTFHDKSAQILGLALTASVGLNNHGEGPYQGILLVDSKREIGTPMGHSAQEHTEQLFWSQVEKQAIV